MIASMHISSLEKNRRTKGGNSTDERDKHSFAFIYYQSDDQYIKVS